MKTQINIWQHGNGAFIEHSGQTILLRRTGNALRVVGAAGSTNWLHYPMPLHQYTNQNSLRLVRIHLRYRCDSATAVITNVALFDAEKSVFEASGLNLCAYDWEEIELNVEDELILNRGLNLSVGLRFDGADDDTHALEISSVGVEIEDEKT